MDKFNLHSLLARYMDTEYPLSLLANVSATSFGKLKAELIDRFDEQIDANDVKAAWKQWFVWAANNGTLVSGELTYNCAECNWRHDELRVIDLVIDLAEMYIDKL